ncbi:NDR1/HIN1-like protein 1 [Actinidia eriantha]|uniref:NDR1/HIN1-like protein 1 n=1 Tax=Actinidia eriantha TaxID=165200 RepID=UPI00258AFBC3|nr:NDR1/HIN1-like protein 1 [Actinidia eriantha]
MTEKECSHHKDKRKKLLRRICAGLLIFNLILLLLLLITWAILQPKKPRFVLQDATIYTFNLSAPNLLSTTIAVTIAAHNPNSNIGIYYDKLAIYATYSDQQITYYTSIPPAYQGHTDVNIWSPYVIGTNIPVAPYNSAALSQDATAGSVMLFIKIDGRVRWKVGTFISGKYHLYVKCPAMITFGGQSTGVVVDNAVKYQLAQSCSVSV